jgi:hypothetical protein
VCAYYHHAQQRLPGWLKAFAQIKVVVKEGMTEVDAVATGLTMAASMEAGVVRLCWHEQAVVMQQKGGAFAKKMQGRIGVEYSRVCFLVDGSQ